jgi:hypothetical protein
MVPDNSPYYREMHFQKCLKHCQSLLYNVTHHESANAAPGLVEPPKVAPPAAQPPCELELLKLASPPRLSTEGLQLLAFAISGMLDIININEVSAKITLLNKVSLFIRSKNLK